MNKKKSTGLTNLHILTIRTRDYLKQQTPSYYHKYPGIIRTDNDMLDVRVTKNTITRSLQIMDQLIKGFEDEGQEIRIIYRETRVVFEDNIYFNFYIRERFTYTGKLDEFKRREAKATGKLSLTVHGYPGKVWEDSRIPLEDKIEAIITYVNTKAKNKKERLIERAEEELLREKQIEEARAKQEIINDEINQFRKLLSDANRWNQATILRNYLNHNTFPRPYPRSGKALCLTWAMEKVDWLDPQTSKEDPTLGYFDDLDKELKNEFVLYK